MRSLGVIHNDSFGSLFLVHLKSVNRNKVVCYINIFDSGAIEFENTIPQGHGHAHHALATFEILLVQ